ncbi:hypothetical protein Tco_1046356 [Tanacetum coccineum]
MVTKNKLGTGSKRLKGRDWTDMDVKKSHEMIDMINKVLKRREHIIRLEEYVGGRPKTINPSFGKLLEEIHVSWTQFGKKHDKITMPGDGVAIPSDAVGTYKGQHQKLCDGV